MIVYRVSKANGKAVHPKMRVAGRKGFVAIDPGVSGGWVVWVRGDAGWQVVDCGPFNKGDGYSAMVLAVKKHGVRLGILEDSFLGKNAAAFLQLTWWAGYCAGWLASNLVGFSLVRIRPATWQAALPHPGIPWAQFDAGRKHEAMVALARQFGVSAMMEERQENLSAFSGVESATGIGWWASRVCDGE